MIIENSLSIQAPISKVWDTLVNPEKTKIYMFGCEAFSDWKVGSPLLWNALWEGQEMTFVKGVILEIKPPFRLVYTTFDPNSNLLDIAENYTAVTYDLEEKEGATHLSISQGDYSKVADGEKRYKESMEAGGWSSILEQIKQLLEK